VTAASHESSWLMAYAWPALGRLALVRGVPPSPTALAASVAAIRIGSGAGLLSGMGSFIWVVIWGIRGAEVQVGIQVCEAQQPLDDWGCARYDELLSSSGQAFMCPDEDRKTGAVGEVKPGQVHHDGRRVALQGTVDGVAQAVPVGHVKLALQPEH
jgi:hypothetical protein